MPRPLAPKGGNDRVYTPPALAKAIVDHFNPATSACVLEPCAGPIGKQAFVDALIDYDLGWCELDEGTDFFTRSPTSFRYDWVITNPPWSKLRAFLKKSMECSNNVVFLCLVNAFFMKARLKDMADAGFGMKEILFVPTPPKPWPQTGFALGAVHIQRGYTGNVTLSKLNE
jgi:hypothetical protein